METNTTLTPAQAHAERLIDAHEMGSPAYDRLVRRYFEAEAAEFDRLSADWKGNGFDVLTVDEWFAECEAPDFDEFEAGRWEAAVLHRGEERSGL